jgi:hypothetical protein
MWRLTPSFFIGMFTTALFTNGAAVYLLHDVDADRIGKWNLAFWELTLEFFIFSLVLTVSFFLLTWIGTMVFRLRHVAPNLKLGFALGIAVMLIQYPAELTARKLTSGHSADSFLLGYILLSPICCAAIVLFDAHKRRAASPSQTPTEASLGGLPGAPGSRPGFGR